MGGIPAPVRVVTADDHPVYREGLAKAIDARPDLVLVADAAGGREALVRIEQEHPDVALLDIRMPEMGGLEVLAAIAAQGLGVPVVLLSAFDDPSLVYAAMTRGAAGYLPKYATRATICDALVAVARGGTVIAAELQAGFVGEVRQRAAADQPVLSEREREILALTAEGLSRSAIGERLFLSPHTVKTHLQRIYEKLGVNDRAAMIAEAMRRGLLA